MVKWAKEWKDVGDLQRGIVNIVQDISTHSEEIRKLIGRGNTYNQFLSDIPKIQNNITKIKNDTSRLQNLFEGLNRIYRKYDIKSKE